MHKTVVIVHSTTSWTDWFLASGVVATLLGLLLTILWELRNRRRNRRNLDIALLTMMEEEIATNLAVLQLNAFILGRELEAVDTGATMVDALAELQMGAWESAIGSDLQRWLPEHTAIFAHFRAAGLSSAQFNSLIRERAQFRLQGIASQKYPAIMRELDEAILEKTEKIRPQLLKLQEDVQQLEVTIGLRKPLETPAP
jgi:hypothetical protein